MSGDGARAALQAVLIALAVLVLVAVGWVAYLAGYSNGVADMETCVATAGLVCPTG